MAEAFVGEIRMFGGNFAISQWEMCNGQLLAISQNQALFAILGTTYGGNGTQNFALPDFRGRVPLHQGTGTGQPTYALGQAAGNANVTLLTGNLPSHNHISFATPPSLTINGSSGTGAANTPAGNFLAGKAQGAALNAGDLYATSPGTLGALGTGSVTFTGNPSTGPTGSNLPVSVLQPYLAVTFLICLFGVFPSRN